MKLESLALLDQIRLDPQSWLIVRSENYYESFMNLHLDVSYPPVDPSQLFSWRKRTWATWRLQDKILPGNCVGGAEGGQIASTLAVIPISSKVLYAHSGAMTRTLRAAATLFAAALYTVDEMDRFPEIAYWLGIYTYPARFVTTWQRPKSLTIRGQLELEEIRVYPRHTASTKGVEGLKWSPWQTSDDRLLGETQKRLVDMLMDVHGAVKEHYRVTCHLISGRDDRPSCAVLVGDTPDEFTAFNVLKWPWILPLGDTVVSEDFIDSLYATDSLKGRVLRVLIDHQDSVIDWQSQDYKLVRAFLAFTPRDQLDQLRASLKEAFAPLFDKYSEQELLQLTAEHNSRPVDHA